MRATPPASFKRRGRRPVLLGFGALVCAIGPSFAMGETAERACPSPQLASNMITTLDSEFARTGSADPAHWHAFSGLHGSVKAELQAFSHDEVRMEPGTGLDLLTDKKPFLGRVFSAGEITTEGFFSQRFGHFEMMAKVPQANGMWPAFWLLPASGAWPPEIDIVEYMYAPWGHVPDRLRHHASNPQTTLHWRDAGGRHQQSGQGVNSPIGYFDTYEDWGLTPAPTGWDERFAGYHKYAIDWRPQSVTWMIDGKVVFCVTDDPASGQLRSPQQRMFIIINDAITAGTKQRPGWPGYLDPNTVFPQPMTIAYVKASRFKDLPDTDTPAISLRSFSASAAAARQGDYVTLTATLVAAPGTTGDRMKGSFTLRRFDTSQYTGIGAVADSVNFHLGQERKANSFRAEATYRIRRDTPPGDYSLGVSVATSDPAKRLQLAQGALLRIVEGAP